ncbi:hypothetical protein [Streptomyces sp. ODS28]|uniref:hypothetical protein n=1 Tax=Streptomyces sp. ODS28 TaxID=3136688 RepID=UPI0031ED57AC
MSKRQKGRKHRTVNRTPRPAGPGRERAREPERTAATTAQATTAQATTAQATTAQATTAPATTAPAPAHAGGGERPAPPGTAKAQATARDTTPAQATKPASSTTPAQGAPGERTKAEAAPAGAAAGTAAGAASGGEQYAPVFTSPAKEGGLGRTAARTWEALGESGEGGSTAEELSGSAGYTPATVRKHLSGLARYGLAEQRGDRWYPTDRSQWDAVPADRSPAGSAAG